MHTEREKLEREALAFFVNGEEDQEEWEEDSITTFIGHPCDLKCKN